MILLWGHASDEALRAVHAALAGRGADVAFYDQRRVLETDVELAVGAEVSGTLRVSDDTLDLGTVMAAYIRPFDSRWLPAVRDAGPESAEWRHAVCVEDALISWSDLAPGLVINRPAAMTSNSSKPFQAALIRDCGFAVPDTLVTTDAAAAREFWRTHGTVVYKSVSSSRSMVSRLTPQQADRLDDIRWCPTQFQQHVPGIDCRVHVVGDRVFACEIVSEADDYRFAVAQHQPVDLRRAELPDDIARRCRALASSLGLIVAGIDLRRTPGGEWFCFEANAVPLFTYYQDATGDRMDAAIAELLLDAAARPSGRHVPAAGRINTGGVAAGS